VSKKLEFSLSIPALAEYVGVVRLAISGIATRMNFTIDEIEDIKISISEACTNAIQHAYGDRANPEKDVIDIKIYIINTELEIVVKDFGNGFDLSILGTKEQKEQSKAKMGLGLGLTFIKSLMDKTNFESTIGKGTEIKMQKKSQNIKSPSLV
jgi:serine/threonine-protein kinase RsbW